MKEDSNKIHMNDRTGFEFGYTYAHNRPNTPFEFTIFNKKNDNVRARVVLNEVQLLALMKAIAVHLGMEEAE